MDERDASENDFSELRRRAEAAMKNEARTKPDMSREAILELVHDLRTHQIELEMQNEELRRTQRDLERTRDRYSTLYNSAPVGFLTMDTEGVIEEANRTSEGLLGVEPGKLVGQPFTRFVAREHQDILYLHRRHLKETGVRSTCELQLLGVDDEPFWGELESTIVKEEAGDPTRVLSALTDISLRKQSDRELVKWERLHALDELSAGVSHNLNNILTTILGPAQMLLRASSDAAAIQEVEQIIRSATRAADLVHKLHQSTRGGEEGEPISVDVNVTIRSVLELARPRWQDELRASGVVIDVETDLQDVPPVRATEQGLHDVFLNLLLNAITATSTGGTIDIRSRWVDHRVQIVFSDTGVGMDEEVRRRVFEPFFTTKADVGSGLGLSTAANSIAAWGGEIDVESAPDEGATFTVTLRAWNDAAPGRSEETADPPRRARVLIVDDDEHITTFLKRLIQARYDIETARDGRSALKIFESTKYDVAIIDLGLPDLPGDTVMKEFQRRDPTLGTISITGWAFDQDDPRLAGFDFRIKKPFGDIEAVERIVAEAISLHGERVAAEASE